MGFPPTSLAIAYFNLLARYRKTWLNSLGAEWRTDLQVGRTSNLFSEFYQPLNAVGDFFVSPNVLFERRSSTLYSGDSRLGRYDFVSSQFASASAPSSASMAY